MAVTHLLLVMVIINTQQQLIMSKSIDAYTEPPVDGSTPDSQLFSVELLEQQSSGARRIENNFDYQQINGLNVSGSLYESETPQNSSGDDVAISILNAAPAFTQTSYHAEVLENSAAGTHVLTVSATEEGGGQFGPLIYSLAGEQSKYFSINRTSGKITIGNTEVLDREQLSKLTMLVVANNGAPVHSRYVATALIHIKILDENDNRPVFRHRLYNLTIDQNWLPPSPILQLQAEDPDEGENGAVRYSILLGNENDVFRLNRETGVLYPVASLKHHVRQFRLEVEGRDGLGRGRHADNATVILQVQENLPISI